MEGMSYTYLSSKGVEGVGLKPSSINKHFKILLISKVPRTNILLSEFLVHFLFLINFMVPVNLILGRW